MKASFSFYMDPSERVKNIRMDAAKGGGSIYDIGCYCIGVHEKCKFLVIY
ncbi:hypothetical protein [Caldifermentibacillus hisashii]